MSKLPRLSKVAPLTAIQKELSRTFEQMEKQAGYIPHNEKVLEIISGDRTGTAITLLNLQARCKLWSVRQYYKEKINVSDIESKRLVSLAGFVKARGRGGISTSWTGLHYLEWDKEYSHKDYTVKIPYEFYVPVPVLGNLLAAKAMLDYHLKLGDGLKAHINTNRNYVERLIEDGYEAHEVVVQYRKVENDIVALNTMIEYLESKMLDKRHSEVNVYLRRLDKILRREGIDKFFLPVVIKKMLDKQSLLDEDYDTHIELTNIYELYE